MSLLRVFWSRLTSVATNAIFVPSGESCGSDTRVNLSISSTVNAGGACAAAWSGRSTSRPRIRPTLESDLQRVMLMFL
jgi:hypothetical protein